MVIPYNKCAFPLVFNEEFQEIDIHFATGYIQIEKLL